MFVCVYRTLFMTFLGRVPYRVRSACYRFSKRSATLDRPIGDGGEFIEVAHTKDIIIEELPSGE